jgi:hypothetical protein
MAEIEEISDEEIPYTTNIGDSYNMNRKRNYSNIQRRSQAEQNGIDKQTRAEIIRNSGTSTIHFHSTDQYD